MYVTPAISHNYILYNLRENKPLQKCIHEFACYIIGKGHFVAMCIAIIAGKFHAISNINFYFSLNPFKTLQCGNRHTMSLVSLVRLKEAIFLN